MRKRKLLFVEYRAAEKTAIAPRSLEACSLHYQNLDDRAIKPHTAAISRSKASTAPTVVERRLSKSKAARSVMQVTMPGRGSGRAATDFSLAGPS
jgi:hypothetical protein